MKKIFLNLDRAKNFINITKEDIIDAKKGELFGSPDYPKLYRNYHIGKLELSIFIMNEYFKVLNSFVEKRRPITDIEISKLSIEVENSLNRLTYINNSEGNKIRIELNEDHTRRLKKHTIDTQINYSDSIFLNDLNTKELIRFKLFISEKFDASDSDLMISMDMETLKEITKIQDS